MRKEMPVYEASAYGKVLICGEYAALMGCDALGASSHHDLRLRLSFDQPQSDLTKLQHQLVFSPCDIVTDEKSDPLHTLLNYLYHYFDCVAPLPREPMYLSIDSTIAQGGGRGSSAALCCAMYSVFSQMSGVEPNSKSQRLSLLRQCEDFFHGISSGIDPALCMGRGVHLVHVGPLLEDGKNGDLVARRDPSDRMRYVAQSSKSLPELEEAMAASSDNQWFTIETGAPSCSTKQCVKMALSHEKQLRKYAQLYPQYLQSLIEAISLHDSTIIQETLSHMHQGLCSLHVVPAKIQAFVRDLQHSGACAKISGAGACHGDKAGILIAFGPKSTIEKQCLKYGYGHQSLNSNL